VLNAAGVQVKIGDSRQLTRFEYECAMRTCCCHHYTAVLTKGAPSTLPSLLMRTLTFIWSSIHHSHERHIQTTYTVSQKHVITFLSHLLRALFFLHFFISTTYGFRLNFFRQWTDCHRMWSSVTPLCIWSTLNARLTASIYKLHDVLRECLWCPDTPVIKIRQDSGGHFVASIHVASRW